MPAAVPVRTADSAQRHFLMRFSVCTTLALVACELMGWQPSALAPVLTAVLLANLPVSPPPKVALALLLIMGAAAWSAFFLATWLSQTPQLLFGVVGLILFLAFAGLAQGKSQLALTLVLLCFTVVPVMTLTASQYQGLLPGMLVRSMLLAIIFTWIGFAIWPLPSPKKAEPVPPPLEQPVIAAAIGVAIVLPLVLAYLLLGLANAMPVLLTTVLTVAKMQEERGAASARAKLTGNFLGGLVAIAAYYLLAIAPSLLTLTLIIFIIGCLFGTQIVKGGVTGGNALIAYNATLVIFVLALLKGDSNSGTWITRVAQFGIATLFAVGMMTLLWPLTRRRPHRTATA